MATIPVSDGRGDTISSWIKNVLPWLIQFGTVIWFLASLKSDVKYVSGTVAEIKNDAAVTTRAIVQIEVNMGKLETRVDNLDVRNVRNTR